MPTPLCKIAQENGGKVPLDCLFNCRRNCHPEPESREPRCNRCGSTDVRWRQQTGQWVLFSLAPGVLHQCEIDDSDFDAIPDDDEEQLW